ncbi:MAG: hypothetical protein ACYC2Z_01660 [Candidatus Nanopelagicales bacterium]
MWDDLGVSQLAADLLSRGAATIVGLFLAAAATLSLMRTVVIPRALRSAISDGAANAVIWTFRAISRLRRTYVARDSMLAWVGPTTIIVQLLTWLLLYLVAYGLLIYGVSGASFGEAIRQAGSSLFTLGFAAADSQDETIIDFIAAATGPIVIALLIGFLPTIYSAYLEREVEVTMLGATAGEPAWGPELLARFALTKDLEQVPVVLERWSHWAARLRMTHVTYPVLVWVRSARASHHYVTSLLAVLDAAALHLALSRTLPRHQAYAVLLQGGQAFNMLYLVLFSKRRQRRPLPLVGRFVGGSRASLHAAGDVPQMDRYVIATQMAATLDSANGPDGATVARLAQGEEQELTVTRADFDKAVDVLRRSGYPIESDLDIAWEEFRLARSRYEFAALAMAKALDATPAPWSGDRLPPTAVMWPTMVVDMIPEVGRDDDPSGDHDG